MGKRRMTLTGSIVQLKRRMNLTGSVVQPQSVMIMMRQNQTAKGGSAAVLVQSIVRTIRCTLSALKGSAGQLSVRARVILDLNVLEGADLLILEIVLRMMINVKKKRGSVVNLAKPAKRIQTLLIVINARRFNKLYFNK